MRHYGTYDYDKDGIYRCRRCGQPYEPGHSLHCSNKLKPRKTKEENKAEKDAIHRHKDASEWCKYGFSDK